MDESEFQERCRTFVNNNVYSCVTTMVEYILLKSWEDRDAPFCFEDVENKYPRGEIRWNGAWMEFDSESELDEWKAEQMDEIATAKQNELDGLQENLDAGLISQREFEATGSEIEETYSQMEYKLDDACDDAGMLMEEYQEIYEYWLVSSWLCSKLEEAGQPVIPDEHIWGRCTSGQAIVIDGVIRELVKQYVLTQEEVESLHSRSPCSDSTPASAAVK